MGKAQFQKGSFEEASATFSYITRLYAAEPLVAQEARTWLARCYTELGWYYDAEDVLQRFARDSVNAHLRRENNNTQAALLLAQERFAEALPYLQQAVRQERRGRQKGQAILPAGAGVRTSRTPGRGLPRLRPLSAPAPALPHEF